MPLASAGSSNYPYTHDDDDFTTDSNTVMTKAVITEDGKCTFHPWIQLRGRDSAGNVFQADACPECNKKYQADKEALRRRKQELDRQLQALEQSSINGGSSVGTDESSSRDKSSGNQNNNNNNNKSGQAFQYPQPPPRGYYPPGYPFPQQHPMYSPAGPHPGPASSEPGKENGRPPHPPPGPFNPYDPYFAGLAAAYHPAGMGPSDPQQDKYLLKILEDKEEEVKKLRTTLEETQAKLQEQTLLATRLQSTLDQVKSSFEQERKLIELQAEKRAQEQFQAQQQEIFQKQLDLMDKWQSGGGGGAALIKSATAAVGQAPVPVSDEPPAPELGNKAAAAETVSSAASKPALSNMPAAAKTTTTAKTPAKQPEKKHPWSKGTPNGKTSTDNVATTNGGKLQDSMGVSLVNRGGIDFNDSEDEDDDPHKPPSAPPPTPAANQEQPTDVNNSKAKNDSKGSSSSSSQKKSGTGATATKNGKPTTTQPSDHFTPVYVAPSQNTTATPTVPEDPRDASDDVTIGLTVASSTYGEDRIKVVNRELLDPYGDKGTYTGVILQTTGMPHGLGRMIYEEDGRIYEGDWRHGRWHGYGRASFSNGDSYEGEYKFDQRHGKGMYKWHDGRVYDGQFLEDKRHGKGRFTWPDGAVYDGEFVNGQREGHGKYTFADGGQYEGSWKDGRYDGFGTCTWEDGRRYRGEWRNGMAHGRGIETYPNGNVRHEGQWNDDEPVR